MKAAMLGAKRFLEDEKGATAIEYGLIAAMVSVVVVLLASTGTTLSGVFCTLAKTIAGAVSAGGGAICE